MSEKRPVSVSREIPATRSFQRFVGGPLQEVAGVDVVGREARDVYEARGREGTFEFLQWLDGLEQRIGALDDGFEPRPGTNLDSFVFLSWLDNLQDRLSELESAVGGGTWDVVAVDLSSGPFTISGYAGVGTSTGGSINPADYNGIAIQGMLSNNTLNSTQFALSGNQLQNVFTSIEIGGTTLLSASAAGFVYDSGNDITIWIWTGAQLIPSPGNYVLTIA